MNGNSSNRIALLAASSGLALAILATAAAQTLEVAWTAQSTTTPYTFQALGQFPGEFIPADEVVEIAGSQATLVRTDDGITITIETSGLPVDEETGMGAYSVWLPVFNNPELCTDACDIDDLPFFGGDPAVQANVLNVGGNLVQDGRGSFVGFLAVGDASTALAPDGDPLLHPRTAEIHFILRYHGPPMAGHVGDQLRTVWGGCDEEHEGALAVGVGFICFDPQAGAFPLP